ncbi:hypothetical protein C4E44_25335 [Pseudomonas sp. MWU12-2312b]|nr:hypothetical protein C4E44_25335 [Pseudomonas sp. MWU12-2312b]
MKPKEDYGSALRFRETDNVTREDGFEKSLRGLMSEYGKDLEDIMDIFECAPCSIASENKVIGKKKV